MSLNEQFRMYQLASQLVHNNQYDIIHINNEEEEIWLEKYENKISKVIRIFQKGFDWKNHLKTDIARVFQKTKAMEKVLRGKKIEIYNVYVSSYTPIDNWNVLKKPMQLKDKNPLKMKVFFIDGDNFKDELNRLAVDIDVPSLLGSKIGTESETETYIEKSKENLAETLYNKREKVKSVYTYGKPIFTYILLVINIIMFAIVELNGGSTSIENLIHYGAKYNPAIIDGEWWRIISSMFLHIGFIHILMNMIALYYLGTAVEKIYGSWRFICIYFLAGLGGGITSFAFTENLSAGASGAIFGLFGALLFFSMIHKKIFRQTMGNSIFILIGFNIVLGFIVPQIDNGAHLGGLIAGFIASVIFHLPGSRKIVHQLLAFILYVGMFIGVILYGLQTDFNEASFQLHKIDEFIQEENYDTAISMTTEQLQNPGKYEADLLFLRSYAYLETNNPDLAIKDLEKSVTINNEFSEAYYNMTLIYWDAGETEKAKEAIVNAYELNPEDPEYKKLYEEITDESIQ